jgi:hypothetical protein
MEIAISILALIVSLGILVIRKNDLRERRHKELIIIKTQLIEKTENIIDRTNNALTTVKIVRMKLRELPDSNDKFEKIEQLPPIIKNMEKLIKETERVKKKIISMDTQLIKKSKDIIEMQSIMPNADNAILIVNKAEILSQELLNYVEEMQEKTKK